MDIAQKKQQIKYILAKYNLAYETMEIFHKRNLNCLNCSVKDGEKMKKATSELMEATKLANELLEDVKGIIKRTSNDGHKLS